MSVAKNDILDAFNARFTTKKYDPQRKISTQDFTLILEAARLSPSSFGFEPWNIIVVQNEALRKALLPDVWGAQGTLPTASHFVVFTAKTGENLGPDSKHIRHILTHVKHMPEENQQGMLSKFSDFQQHDFNLHTPESRHHWAARQAYIALGNMLTVAALLGIDSQPVEGFNIARVTETLVKQGLIEPKSDLPVVMASFGYRDMEVTPKTRRPILEAITWA
ncbi:NAD(P)H-dependent oxidoreductase [Buttiauxella warmboldiae]|uniref:NAD(P)H-dependent oxidoreductase n=1 Tax=Buttiauxella warmboldiae TaxID=82993 RepID=A0A3N5E3S1_9ENTR|nr:NAD(P)H-dependent oxidoreductase [Buttiauxella warmboldiae]RPH24002.1 NAD(P)H-dependent oxidoreductase [Buttiauxella warmboldiae]